MKTGKKLFAWLLTAVLCVSFLPGRFLAAKTVTSGICGDQGNNLTWTPNSSGVLTVSGTGSMEDYSEGAAPWHSRRDGITRVELCSGVTSIGSYAFYACDNLKTVSIPAGVSRIGNAAFCGCGNLREVYYSGSHADWNAINIENGNGSLLSAAVDYASGKLLNQNGVFKYYENNKWISDKYAFISFDGRQYLIANGKLARVNGLVQDPNGTAYDWYFCAEGAIVSSHSGFCEYGGEWFLVKNGKLAESYTGSVAYDGSMFHVVNGQIR